MLPKKKISIALLSSAIVLSMSTSAFAANQSIKVLVEGQVLDGQAIVQNNTVLLPLRSLAVALGISNKLSHIEWNNSEKSILITKPPTEIYAKIGCKNAKVNGKNLKLAVAPTLVKGQVFIPSELIVQGLGDSLEWNQASHNVKVSLSNADKAVAVLQRLENGDGAALKRWISPTQYIQHKGWKFECSSGLY
ncbi:copper amine oxidase N-terminal domain-containing protein [Paenibacillus sp. HW567]|uniref:copper amine oxidase N-terminal domain-containing protein n=1 Tax=Paenibacillus sp. HW567 TaxID=1034769 RepID=UPI0003723A03|nr:copper amine oxidase N-terminal domain-containing protein [Paenibacillus sp. HW567]